MKVSGSPYLKERKGLLKQIIEKLSSEFSYVSILATDVSGKRYQVQKNGTSLLDSGWGERGIVVRVHDGLNYTEYFFNDLPPQGGEEMLEEIRRRLKDAQASLKNLPVGVNSYPVAREERIRKSWFGEVEILPEKVSPEEKIQILFRLKERALSLSSFLVDVRVVYEEVQVAKIFLSAAKELEQSYIWSQAYLIPILRKDNRTWYFFKSFSGLKGVEIIAELESALEDAIRGGELLLEADRVEPGKYEVICSPDIAGLIAHEAFGHGVEMDMFVKNRARAVEYLNKQVASPLVTMHDGARAAEHVSSYLFDDEGTLGTDTVIIENGILKGGISDLLSSLRLGTHPTGNGKRESFERKAYARMTNTFFAPGEDTLEEMIASIRHGYLLERYQSGMEDPKNWGIQCVILYGREIKDGRLTGKIISPIIMTGYVPELLKSITMVSGDMSLSGSGMCGKGHKEYVKTSSGGPYLKAVARLG